jgi:hypothetical protein
MQNIGGMLEDRETIRDTSPKLKLTQFHGKDFGGFVVSRLTT